jgi:hypothetical protein
MLIKRRPSPITLPLYSNLTHLNPTPFPTTPSHHYWKPLSTSNPLPPRLKRSEVQAIINNLPPKKSPGYDLMTGKTLKEVPTLRIQYLTQFFNAILLCGHFPAQWKFAQIILIPKPGKPPPQLSSASYPLPPKFFKSSFSNASFRWLNIPSVRLPAEALHNFTNSSPHPRLNRRPRKQPILLCS